MSTACGLFVWLVHEQIETSFWMEAAHAMTPYFKVSKKIAPCSGRVADAVFPSDTLA